MWGGVVSDEDLFQAEMAGVVPLNRDPRERLQRKEHSGDDAARRLAAAGTRQGPVNALVDELMPVERAPRYTKT